MIHFTVIPIVSDYAYFFNKVYSIIYLVHSSSAYFSVWDINIGIIQVLLKDIYKNWVFMTFFCLWYVAFKSNDWVLTLLVYKNAISFYPTMKLPR